MSSADDWITQETSNSEDSSLSDSDRTLVGDAPDHSELDVDTAFSPTSVLRPNSYFINENSEEDVNVHKYFKIVKLPQPDTFEKFGQIFRITSLLNQSLYLTWNARCYAFFDTLKLLLYSQKSPFCQFVRFNVSCIIKYNYYVLSRTLKKIEIENYLENCSLCHRWSATSIRSDK
ncbi:unnamed protein product [Trichogramma brassicae]|uniref:Uncharacterized protein n=1 Tax=Trichogramma brassicae TaxID=86971 RepID=A0A6H5HZP4_9HYME|nr:unnamed protein product [Trichogramma brassicae]